MENCKLGVSIRRYDIDSETGKKREVDLEKSSKGHTVYKEEVEESVSFEEDDENGEHLAGYEVSQDPSKGAMPQEDRFCEYMHYDPDVLCSKCGNHHYAPDKTVDKPNLIDPSDPKSGPLCKMCYHYHPAGGSCYD